ncbi:Sbal_3080 family lipoprotein [Porticoccus sp. GXU_MW_L64]
MKKIALLMLLVMISGCTSIDVSEVDKSHQMTHVCIKNNPKVIVKNFVQVIEDGFQDHLITTEVYMGQRPAHCKFWLTYTALRSWDFSPYLSHAELRLFKDHSRIGYADYHLKGKGGFALNKWASVKSKMTPVINQLLGQYE